MQPTATGTQSVNDHRSTFPPTGWDGENSGDIENGNPAIMNSTLTIVMYVGCGVVIGIIISIPCSVIMSKRKSVKQHTTIKTTIKKDLKSISMENKNTLDILEMEFNVNSRNNFNVVNEKLTAVEGEAGEAGEQSQEGIILYNEQKKRPVALEDRTNVTHDSDTEMSIKYKDDPAIGNDDKNIAGDNVDTSMLPLDKNGDDFMASSGEEMYITKNHETATGE